MILREIFTTHVVNILVKLITASVKNMGKMQNGK